MATERPRTLGELRASGYRMESVKDELRRNLIGKIQRGEPLFPDILGYEETVIPQIQNAILSRHDMLFLGLRGQAKTRMARALINLLDEEVPILAGSIYVLVAALFVFGMVTGGIDGTVIVEVARNEVHALRRQVPCLLGGGSHTVSGHAGL